MSLFSTISKFITGMVGDQRENRPEDVRQIKNVLDRLGYFNFRKEPEPHGYITREMDEGIRRYQKERGLRVDGWLKPGGETEKSLRKDLKRHVSDDIVVEELPAPIIPDTTIPGTNIPDRGWPEDWVLPRSLEKPWVQYRTNKGSKEIEKTPPMIDPGILLPYDPNVPVVVKKRRKYKDL